MNITVKRWIVNETQNLSCENLPFRVYSEIEKVQRMEAVLRKSLKYTTNMPVSVTPMDEINGFSVRPGMFDSNGAMALPVGVNFTVHTHHGTLLHSAAVPPGEDEPYAEIPFPESYKIGDVYSMIVFDLDIREFEYAYRVDRAVPAGEGASLRQKEHSFGSVCKGGGRTALLGRYQKGLYHARVVQDVFDWGTMPQSSRGMSDLVIYELHVRGFTRHASSGVKNKGTFAASWKKSPISRELGINAVELMPIFEFDEMMNAREAGGQKASGLLGLQYRGIFCAQHQLHSCR